MGDGSGFTLKFDSSDNLTYPANNQAQMGTLDVITSLKLTNTVLEFSIDGTLGNDSDSTIPTKKAVKIYIEGKTFLNHSNTSDSYSLSYRFFPLTYILACLDILGKCRISNQMEYEVVLLNSRTSPSFN